MNVAWVDTETTGLNPKEHGIHEFALIIVRDKIIRDRRVFHFNPTTCSYDEGSKVAHGKSEEEIRAYPPEAEIFPRIQEVLARNSGNGAEKMVFAGYNCPFDYGFIIELMVRNGDKVENYFTGKFIDVLELVRRGSKEGKLPCTTDKKLGTMCKALGVNLDNAHAADADIAATRELAMKLHLLGVKA